MDYVHWNMSLNLLYNSICLKSGILFGQNQRSTQTHKCKCKQTFCSKLKLKRKKFNQLEFYTIDTWHFPLMMTKTIPAPNHRIHDRMLREISCWSRAIWFENFFDIVYITECNFPGGVKWKRKTCNKLCVAYIADCKGKTNHSAVFTFCLRLFGFH